MGRSLLQMEMLKGNFSFTLNTYTQNSPPYFTEIESNSTIKKKTKTHRVCSKGVPKVRPGVMYRFHTLLSSLELWIGSKTCRWPRLRCADATRTWWTGDDLGDQRHEVRLGKMQERRVFKDESNCVQTRWRIRLPWGLLSIIQQTQSHGLTRWLLISQGKHRAGTSWSVN